MPLKLPLFLVALLSFSSLYGQGITVSGYVLDSLSHERQPGASVAETHSRRQTVSNEYGFFSLTLPALDSVTVVAYALGYKMVHWAGKISRDTIMSLYMAPQGYLLQGVDITAPTNPAESGSKVNIPLSTIRELPALAGQVDVLRSFQLLPGISGGAEGSSGLHIRGGSPDQNLVLMDDVPLYSVNHLGGFLSVFNADAVQSIQVYKGNPPTRFGGRLSGVTDVRLREGNNTRHRASIEAGLVSMALLLEGPLGRKRKTTYLLSMRRFNYDLILRGVNLFQPPGFKSPYLTFDDVNAKVSHVFSDKDRISLSVFSGSDRFIDRPGRLEFRNDISEDRYKLAWGNRMAALRWHRLWNPKLFSNMTASWSEFKYESTQYGFQERSSTTGGVKQIISQTEQQFSFTSRIRDAMLRWDFEYNLSHTISVKSGVMATQHWFRPNVTAYKNSSLQNPADTLISPEVRPVFEPAAYLEIHLKPNYPFQISTGLHWAAYQVDNTIYSMPQPQVALSWQANKKLGFHASVNGRYQGLHLLTGNGLGLPLDFWLPATRQAPPQRSVQQAAGLRYDLGGSGDWAVHSDVFFKKFSRQIDFQEGASFFTGSQEWESKIERDGRGQAYGWELLIEKKRGKTTGWVSYTLSKSIRQFKGINGGLSYPYPYDRRHNLALVVQHNLRPNLKLSIDWVFSSGLPLTLPAAVYPAIQPGYLNSNDGKGTILPGTRFINALYYNRRNDYRMPAYHRLDVSFQFLKQKKNGLRIWSFGAYNAYNQLNPYYLYYGFDAQANIYRLYKFTLFPIIPSVSYRREFDIKKQDK